MKFKRIAVISYHTCPLSDEDVTQTGGLNIYVLELSKALAKKGFILDIYTRDVSKASPKVVNVSENLRVIHLKGGKQCEIPKRKLIKYIPQFLKSFFTFVQKENLTYDFVYSHYYLSGLVGIEIKKKLKIPLIINFHTLGLMKNLVARSDEEKEDLERIKVERLLLEKADKTIASSSLDAKYISTLYDYPHDKIFVLTPGVNLNLFKPIDKLRAKKAVNANGKHKLILFVGRLEPLKGIDVLLYALKILVQRIPKLIPCLWIVGGGAKERKRLESIGKVLGLCTCVRFLGKKNQHELPFYYNASELTIMPSQYESFGIAALESMACGTPVITTDVTGISALFDEPNHPLITSAGNPTFLAKKIEDLLGNEKEYKRLSLEVLNKAKSLGWDRIADRFKILLES